MQPLLTLIVQLIEIVKYVVNIYVYVIIVWVVTSWLVAFDVINLRNNFVRMLYDVLNRLTEPVMRPIRRLLPNLGGLDLSPLVVFVLIMVIQQILTFVQREVLLQGMPG